ncbi:MAG: hypothetical protein WD894_04560 [Pirellulales bacterium]
MTFFRSLAAMALIMAELPMFAQAQIATVYNRGSAKGDQTARDRAGSNAAPSATPPRGDTSGAWRSPVAIGVVKPAGPAQALGVRETSSTQPSSLPAGDETVAPKVSRAKVTSGNGTLPNDQGQVWREYDITSYTARVTSTNRPEQAIIDWILRETGYEAWHGETPALLAADARTLRVYHTPQTQAIVGEVVDRFVNSEAETHAFSIRVISLDSPSWRAKAQRMLRPVNVQTQGVQAWLLAKEDAALLQGELRKRNDHREHSAPHLLVNNGQTAVATAARTHNYVRGVLLSPEAWPGFQPISGQIDEGYSLELSPLLSLDGRTIDAVVKCNLDQVEELQPVMLDVPTAAAPRQRTQVQVPKLSSFRLHERFRWPVEQVLLIGCGMVAPPVPVEQGLRLPLVSTPPRVDLLIFVESRGPNGRPATVMTTPIGGGLPASR